MPASTLLSYLSVLLEKTLPEKRAVSPGHETALCGEEQKKKKQCNIELTMPGGMSTKKEEPPA